MYTIFANKKTPQCFMKQFNWKIPQIETHNGNISWYTTATMPGSCLLQADVRTSLELFRGGLYCHLKITIYLAPI